MKVNCNFKSVDVVDNTPLSTNIEEECNLFLSTRKGLQYLLMKYPNLSISEAIRKYKSACYIANNF